MTKIRKSGLKKSFHQLMRKGFSRLPSSLRFRFYRYMVNCDPEPDARLELKIAETQEELEACFRILHDAYVASGFMKPDASGMRVTIYHALPTTTTLCAKYDGRVVGTISMIRDGVFGFPLQSVFELEHVRAKGGNIAEISALAVHPDFRQTGGAVLFPLMKFMREYCVDFFDTRHLMIAVNPEKIELYEALLFFKRLQEKVVENYDFANGAPAVGATLDLSESDRIFAKAYRSKPPRKNLHNYFFRLRMPNIKIPRRRYFTTNDPVMTPALLDYFFNQKTHVFADLDDRKKSLLWSIYNVAEYRSVLPMLITGAPAVHPLRQHQRYSLRCPGVVKFRVDGHEAVFVLLIIEVSLTGFQAQCYTDLPMGQAGQALIELGKDEHSDSDVKVVRRRDTDAGVFFGFKIDNPDPIWRRCVAALEMGQTSADLLQ